MTNRNVFPTLLALLASSIMVVPSLAANQREADAGRVTRLDDGRVRITFDFTDAAQFSAWKAGPTDAGKAGRYDFGNRPVSWQWQPSKSQVRGNGGYLVLPRRLSAEDAITVEFVAGLDNGNIHCGLFTGEPRFTAKGGGFYFNAGGCSKSFTSLADNGEWFARKKLPFQTGLYPIRLAYTPLPNTNKVRLVYSVNGETYFDVTRPRPKDAARGLTFGFLSGWVGGGYSVDRVTITGKPATPVHAAR